MPTSGTHITIVQRLALNNKDLRPFLGDPTAKLDSDSGKLMRFANLGAVGPDIFYAMADYTPAIQDLEDILIKVAGSFEAISDVMAQIQRYIDGVINEITLGIVEGFEKTFSLISSTINDFFLSLLIDSGLNLWPVFKSARQMDMPRTQWYWADYLHYVRTGRVVTELLKRSANNKYLRAYGLGYLTHYVTDVVGHPYVNQVVQAPWRLYWQRHHLVENFIDAYVWDRWHTSNPPPPPPSVEEQPLDSVTLQPNASGAGAPFTYARLNDLINIGTIGIADPVDQFVTDAAQAIARGVNLSGIIMADVPPAPHDQDFMDWTKMMDQTLRAVYQNDPLHPRKLAGNDPNLDGFPKTDDIAAAYGVMRYFLKLSTEDKIQEPRFPNVIDDISQAVQQVVNDLSHDLGALRPPPLPSTGGHFSLHALWDAIKNAAKWVGSSVVTLAKAAFHLVKNLVGVALTPVKDAIKIGFWLINKALFALYRYFRNVLVFAGYNIPFTDQLAVQMADDFNTADLWQTKGDLPVGQYPVEEVAEERKYTSNSYAPIIPPKALTGAFEHPAVSPTAPYPQSLPDRFIDKARGDIDLFVSAPGGLANAGPARLGSADVRDFGGAMDNCLYGINKAIGGIFNLPNYNLDGDRGYAWPCWRVEPEPQPNGAGPIDPLDPLNNQNVVNGQVTVNPKLLDDYI